MEKSTHIKHTIRFRRWSRKAYATFASIGRYVTIGFLRKSIADSSLGKQKTKKTAGHTICSTEVCPPKNSEEWETDTVGPMLRIWNFFKGKGTGKALNLLFLFNQQILCTDGKTSEAEKRILNTSIRGHGLSEMMQPKQKLQTSDKRCPLFCA